MNINFVLKQFSKTIFVTNLLILIFASYVIGSNNTYPLPSDLLTNDGIKKDRCRPLIDFENLASWSISTQNAVAKFQVSEECLLWGKKTGKLTFRRQKKGNSKIVIAPPNPIKINEPFNVVQCWIWRDVWSWVRHPKPAAQITIKALFSCESLGKSFKVILSNRPWKGWLLCYIKLAEQQRKIANKNVCFDGFEITGQFNDTDNIAFFDNFALIDEDSSKPLKFKPRPKRGIDMFNGQSQGMNIGKGRLPFPTRKETILPTNLCEHSINKIYQDGDMIMGKYKGDDGNLLWRISLKKGPFNGIAFKRQEQGKWIMPCQHGGIYLVSKQGKSVYPKTQKLIAIQRIKNYIETNWLMIADDGVSTRAKINYRIWGKTLVINIISRGGKVSALSYGYGVGFENPKLITLPYHTYKAQGTPAVVAFGTSDKPLFFASNTDWYRSNASEIRAKHFIEGDKIIYDFGVLYHPKTNGKRNHCYERFFLTVSNKLEEVLPNIANPTSPWKHITGTKIWRTYG